MNAYFLGLGSALVLVISTGPVFLSLIQNSISNGFKKTLLFVLGVAVADTTIILLTWLGLSKVSGDQQGPWLTIAGAIVLIVFGIIYILKKEKKEEVIEGSASSGLAMLIQGVMMGAINPIVWGFWATISNYSITTFDSQSNQLLYFAGLLNMVWVTDVLKAYYAQKLKTILSEKVRYYFRLGIGVLLIGMGVSMVIQYIYEFVSTN
ncbi:MAG: LysE family transporter [Reichenbachiella sp.]